MRGPWPSRLWELARVRGAGAAPGARPGWKERRPPAAAAKPPDVRGGDREDGAWGALRKPGSRPTTPIKHAHGPIPAGCEFLAVGFAAQRGPDGPCANRMRVCYSSRGRPTPSLRPKPRPGSPPATCRACRAALAAGTAEGRVTGGGWGEWLLARWSLGCSPYTRGQSQAARAAEATSPPAGVLEAGARRAGSPEASLAGRLLRAPRVTPLCVCVPVAPSLEDTGHVAPAPTPVTSLPPF